MNNYPSATIEIWGDFALWSRPENKVERATYPVPTPSGIRGVLSAIYAKPAEFYWQVQKIEVLQPIRYITFIIMAIENRYEFIFYIECRNGNPNGDPDIGNSPRMDPQDLHGYITDVAIKRRIRNYVQTAYQGEARMEMLVRSASNINTGIAHAKKAAA